jgi:hypothetical protein
MRIARRLLLPIGGAVFLVLVAFSYANRTTASMLDPRTALEPQADADLLLPDDSAVPESLTRAGSPAHGFRRSNLIRRSRLVSNAAAMRSGGF